MIEILDKKDWQFWENFNHKHGNVFQSTYFLKSLESIGFKVEIIISRDDTNAITGGCACFLTMPRGIRRIFSQYRIVSGPVLKDLNDKDTLNQLLIKIIAQAKLNKCVSIPLRTPFVANKDVLEKNGFRIETKAPSYSFIIDLKKSEDLLWKELKQKTRTAVRKARKNGVTVRKARKEEIKKIYDIYMERVAAKQGWIPYSLEFFNALYEKFEPSSVLFLVAEYNNEIIAETIFLIYRKTAYFFQNASTSRYWNLRANNLLVWGGMKLAKKHGCETYNFYGTSDGKDKKDINYNLYVFKSSFGGKLIEEFMYCKLIVAPIKEFLFEKILLKIALPFYKKITKRKNKNG